METNTSLCAHLDDMSNLLFQLQKQASWNQRDSLVYDCNTLKKKVRWPGIEPGSTAWKATMLTITPPSHGRKKVVTVVSLRVKH